MRRGCISLGDAVCDKCHKVIPVYDRYLMVEEEKDKEADKGATRTYCVPCAKKKGYATIKEEKGEKTLTFFA
ncbi:MAG: hypothetical protein A2147_00830 [Chloroflexi bacterium RBG_16_57_8]|nr:MAG: hypothetical protein A2147_00830 [Chloroflexi bacterium RBG_16_57_8]